MGNEYSLAGVNVRVSFISSGLPVLALPTPAATELVRASLANSRVVRGENGNDSIVDRIAEFKISDNFEPVRFIHGALSIHSHSNCIVCRLLAAFHNLLVAAAPSRHVSIFYVCEFRQLPLVHLIVVEPVMRQHGIIYDRLVELLQTGLISRSTVLPTDKIYSGKVQLFSRLAYIQAPDAASLLRRQVPLLR